MNLPILEKIFGFVRVKHIMNEDPVTIKQDEDFSLAALKFKAHHVNYLIVVDETDRVVGLISHKYLYRTLSPRKLMSPDARFDSRIILDGDSYYEKESLDQFILRRMMKPSPVTIRPGEPAIKAVQLMARHDLGCLPVVGRRQRVIGMVTDREIVQYAARVLA
jgi:CBS domain-containing protein